MSDTLQGNKDVKMFKKASALVFITATETATGDTARAIKPCQD